MYYVPMVTTVPDISMYSNGSYQHQTFCAILAQQQHQLREIVETQEKISLNIKEKERILERLEE